MDDNGILARVPSWFVAQAIKTLPNPATAKDLHPSVVIDAGHAGRVRIFYRRMKATHHKHSHYFWAGVRAEAVPSDSTS